MRRTDSEKQQLIDEIVIKKQEVISTLETYLSELAPPQDQYRIVRNPSYKKILSDYEYRFLSVLKGELQLNKPELDWPQSTLKKYQLDLVNSLDLAKNIRELRLEMAIKHEDPPELRSQLK